MSYPYDDDEPPICRLCGADLPDSRQIRICVECIRKEQQEKRIIPGARYGRNKSPHSGI